MFVGASVFVGAGLGVSVISGPMKGGGTYEGHATATAPIPDKR